ncbi:hypothetical protein [Photobacterium sp. Hal280]
MDNINASLAALMISAITAAIKPALYKLIEGQSRLNVSQVD